MNFAKYHSAGNDFIIANSEVVDFTKVSLICDRRFGIGADGILLHFPPQFPENHAKMQIVNSDGTFAEMCGNGLCCFAAYLINDFGLSFNPLKIETGRGVLSVSWKRDFDGKTGVSANLGRPSLLYKTEKAVYKGISFSQTGISMGNPHLVILPDAILEEERLVDIADHFRYDNVLNQETNVQIATKIERGEKRAEILVNERGAGFTLACGTGGAAVMHALFINGVAQKGEIWTFSFKGGELSYLIDKEGGIIIDALPKKIFKGLYEG